MIESSAALHDSAVLVTGGAGFIGSHLVDALFDAGARRVVVIDDLRTGRWDNISNDERITRITADFAAMSEDDVAGSLKGIDYLFHLAAEKHNNSIDAPGRVLEVNVNGTFRLFRAAVAARVKKVIFTSSLYANGRMSLPPMREDDVPIPTTIYGISKLAGEHLLRHFGGNAGLRWTAFRLFFTYGPKQFAGSGYKSVIVTNFDRILRNESPVIFGDGEQALDYNHVSDVAAALLAGTSPRADSEVFNVGSGSAVSVNRLTDAMLLVARSSLRPVNAAADWTAGTYRVCDNAKIRERLGWEPSVSLLEGLASVYDWMKTGR